MGCTHSAPPQQFAGHSSTPKLTNSNPQPAVSSSSAFQKFKEQLENCPDVFSPQDIIPIVRQAYDDSKQQSTVGICLDGHHLGDKGALLLAQLLRSDCHVNRLSLQSCAIRDSGAERIVMDMKFNSTLSHINLSHNAIGAKGAAALLNYMEVTPHLLSVNLSHAQLDCNASKIIALTFIPDSKIRHVDLSHNSIGHSGATSLVLAARSNYSLLSVNIQANSPEADALQPELDDILARNNAAHAAVEDLLSATFAAIDRKALEQEKLVKQKGAGVFSLKLRRRSLPSSKRLEQAFVPPTEFCVSEPLGHPASCLRVSMAESRGARRAMQDVTLSRKSFLGNPKWSLFGVFDGHGGLHCSRFVGRNFAHVFESHLREAIQENTANAEVDVTDHGPLDGTIAVSVLKASLSFLNSWCTESMIPHGTCALVTFLDHGTVYTANVGDSQAILCHDDQHHSEVARCARTAEEKACSVATSLSTVFRPSDPEEICRIQNLNGFVSKTGRVCGVLAVSRAIGDVQFQPFVSAEPLVSVHELPHNSSFTIVMASDGLWDVLKKEHVARVCSDSTAMEYDLAQQLVHESLLCGTRDNVSVVVVSGKQ